MRGHSIIFVDESGVAYNSDGRQPFFGVGALKISNPYPFTVALLNAHFKNYSAIKSERKNIIKDLKLNPRILTTNELNLMLASTRHYEYKFTDITLDKLGKYKDFLRVAFQHDFVFGSIVIDKEEPDFKQEYSNYWDAYIKYTKLLCERLCDDNESVVVLADFNHKPNFSNRDFANELRSLPKVDNAFMLQSVGTPLIQLCDLFLGAVVFQQRANVNQLKDSNRVKAKTEFTSYLTKQLNLDHGSNSLTTGLTSRDNQTFKIWAL
jgi:hypothetical protein